MEKETNKPVDEVKLGSIVASIWKNQSNGRTFYNVTFSRIYKDDDGWKRTESFGRDDLLVLAKVADLAHTKTFELGKE